MLIDAAVRQGLSRERACAALGLEVRTVRRWRKLPREIRRGGNPRPHNALTDDEKAVRAALVARRDLADLTARDLSFYALEKEETYVSPVSFWKYLVRMQANGERVKRQRRGGGERPATEWVTAPNQLWCWDATRLKTFLRWRYFYLFMLQDWFSALIVAWVLVDRETSDAAVELWDQGLTTASLISGPGVWKPKSLSDRGSQMKSRRTRLHLTSLQIEQLFSRPRTPNDNPLIESTFSVMKTRLDYPERFGSMDLAGEWVAKHIRWYNYEHKHSRKGYVTPYELHTGRAEEVIRTRKAKTAEALAERRRVNLGTGQPANERTFVD